MGAIPGVATTRGLRSSAFDRHQEQKKTQLLPKDLAARAGKLSPEQVEAEVLRILSEKPTTPGTVRPGAILPWTVPLGTLQAEEVRLLQAQAAELAQWGRQQQQQMLRNPLGNYWG